MKTHKLGRGRYDLASYQVLLNFVQRFHRRSRKCLSQSEARVAILFFPISPKNTNLVEEVEIYLPVKFRQIPFGGFRGEVRKCEKLTTTDGQDDGRRTDDGQRMITIVHLSLRLRCTKKESKLALHAWREGGTPRGSHPLFTSMKRAKKAVRKQSRKELAIDRKRFFNKLMDNPNSSFFYKLIKRNKGGQYKSKCRCPYNRCSGFRGPNSTKKCICTLL